MKPQPRSQQDARLHGAGKDLAARVESLFARSPELAGFAVHLEAGRLCLTDVGISPQLGRARHNEIFESIAAALAEMLDERPEAAELLRGRTFVRTLH